jgi:hypothetical protein
MMKNIVTICLFLLLIPCIHADELPFQAGEYLKYEIHYKYGFVMVKAGTADYKIESSTYRNRNSYRSTLNFKTSSFFDKIFKIRDSMYSHTNDRLEPLYHQRKINEGNTSFREELFFKKHSQAYCEARVKRENNETVKFDTILHANNIAYDILNIFMFARSLDYPNMRIGESLNLSTFIGKQKVNIVLHFEGQSIINKSEILKYKAYKLVLDITDEVFNESKSSMEVWLSDDENRIPLKIKAKLKIGAAEADLTSCKNLKYPFSSEIKISPR